ncbi:MAG: alpha/beta hydrolase [Bryobacteraceae bacterium]
MMKRVYLHGFASGPGSTKAEFFRRRLPGLAVPDLSGGNFETLTLTGQLAVVEAAAGGEPVDLIGSSMGGYLAALYAARHPEVRRVVLLAPAFRFARRWAEVTGAEKLAEWRRAGFTEVFHYGAGGMRRLGWRLMEDARRYEDFPGFTQPGLILHGSRDPVVPVALSREFTAAHPNVRLVELDSGHELTDVLGPIWAETEPFLATPAG